MNRFRRRFVGMLLALALLGAGAVLFPHGPSKTAGIIIQDSPLAGIIVNDSPVAGVIIQDSPVAGVIMPGGPAA
jgi:hypothetical protein